MKNITIKEKTPRYHVLRNTNLSLLIESVDTDMRLNWKPLGPVVIEKRGIIFPDIYYLQTMVRYDNDKIEQ